MSIPKSKKTAAITCGIYLYSTLLKKILICHATHSSWKTWTIPKGIKEKNEECYDAAARELKEETGIDITTLNIIKSDHFEKIKYEKQNKFLESYLLITDTDLSKHHFECTSIIDNKFPEVDKWKWIDPLHIKNILHESQQKNYDKIMELVKI